MNESIIIDGVKYYRVESDKKVVTELTDEQLRVLRGLIFGIAAIVACMVIVIDDKKI